MPPRGTPVLPAVSQARAREPSAALRTSCPALPAPLLYGWQAFPFWRSDKYGNSIFTGCINISGLYIHFIHHGAGLEGGPRGSPSSTTAHPHSPHCPTHSVQTKANSSCNLCLPREVTVRGGA